MKNFECPLCGKNVDMSAKYCDGCGAPIKQNKNLVLCRTCGKPVAKNAKKCPHCGEHTPNKNNFIAGILAIVFIGIWAIATIVSVGTSNDNANPQGNEQNFSEQTQFEKPERECIIVSAEALWNAYQENEVNADIIYGGKLLAVTGTITNIGKDIVSNAPCVSLDSGSAYGLYPIQCFFPKNGEQTEQIASLSDGDKVTIYGTCTGEFVTNVQLSKCYFEDRS